MPIIQSVEFCAIRIPLDRATSFSNRTVVDRHHGLVRVRWKEGHEDIGFCHVGSAGGGRVLLHQTPGLGFGFDEAAVRKYGRWASVH